MKRSMMIPLLSLAFGSAAYAGSSEYSIERTCTDAESLKVSQGSSQKWIGHYQDFLSGKISPIYGFSQAVQLKKLSAIMVKADFERDFSEYWVGRILFTLGLDPLAHQVFRSVYENTEIASMKKAAFSCLAMIQKRAPDWKAANGSDWMGLPFSADDHEVVFLASQGKMNRLTSTLPAGYKDFLVGLDAIQGKRYSPAIEHFVNFIKVAETKPNSLLSRYLDSGRLFLGRAYYSVGRFKEAADSFHKVKKTSNMQIDALSDLSWSYLLADEYDAALGISMQLRSGAIRNAFAPEPLMVAAMALNELCMFPDSIRMMRYFVNDYGTSHEWLDKNRKHDDLYGEVLKILKRQSQVPAKVASEWLKNPSFLTRQIELNQLIEHPKKLSSIQKKGAFEQTKLSVEFMDSVQKFTHDVKVAKLKLKPGQELSATFGARYLQLRRDLRNLTRYYKASKIWKNLARNYEKKIPNYRAELVAKVNRELASRNTLMLSTLDKIRDNMDLIEVEIYNGASQDLIWKNAHPDYEKMSKDMKDQKEEQNAAKVWNWGRMLASEIDTAEVWEDEVGTLKADISNQCDKKDRYMKLKMKQ